MGKDLARPYNPDTQEEKKYVSKAPSCDSGSDEDEDSVPETVNSEDEHGDSDKNEGNDNNGQWFFDEKDEEEEGGKIWEPDTERLPSRPLSPLWANAVVNRSLSQLPNEAKKWPSQPHITKEVLSMSFTIVRLNQCASKPILKQSSDCHDQSFLLAPSFIWIILSPIPLSTPVSTKSTRFV